MFTWYIPGTRYLVFVSFQHHIRTHHDQLCAGDESNKNPHAADHHVLSSMCENPEQQTFFVQSFFPHVNIPRWQGRERVVSGGRRHRRGSDGRRDGIQEDQSRHSRNRKGLPVYLCRSMKVSCYVFPRRRDVCMILQYTCRRFLENQPSTTAATAAAAASHYLALVKLHRTVCIQDCTIQQQQQRMHKLKGLTEMPYLETNTPLWLLLQVVGIDRPRFYFATAVPQFYMQGHPQFIYFFQTRFATPLKSRCFRLNVRKKKNDGMKKHDTEQQQHNRVFVFFLCRAHPSRVCGANKHDVKAHDVCQN